MVGLRDRIDRSFSIGNGCDLAPLEEARLSNEFKELRELKSFGDYCIFKAKFYVEFSLILIWNKIAQI